MSGGSCDYLFRAELTRMLWAVETVRDRLKELGHPEAAARTEEVVQHMREIDAIQTELEAVWEAVEWGISGDWGKEAVDAAVAEWRAKRNSG